MIRKRRVRTQPQPRTSRTAETTTEALEKALEAAEEKVVSGGDPEGIYASEASTIQMELERRAAAEARDERKKRATNGGLAHASRDQTANEPYGPWSHAKESWDALRAMLPPWVFPAAGLAAFGLAVYLISRWWSSGRSSR